MIRNCSEWFKKVILCKKKSFYGCFPPVPLFSSLISRAMSEIFDSYLWIARALKNLFNGEGNGVFLENFPKQFSS